MPDGTGAACALASPVPLFLSPSFRRSPICSSPYQRFHHLFHVDLRGIEIHHVDLPRVVEPSFDLHHPLQPFQGRFPHVVSGHVKCDRPISPSLGIRVAGASRCLLEENGQHGNEQGNEVPSSWKTHRVLLPVPGARPGSSPRHPSRVPLSVRPHLPTAP